MYIIKNHTAKTKEPKKQCAKTVLEEVLEHLQSGAAGRCRRGGRGRRRRRRGGGRGLFADRQFQAADVRHRHVIIRGGGPT